MGECANHDRYVEGVPVDQCCRLDLFSSETTLLSDMIIVELPFEAALPWHFESGDSFVSRTYLEDVILLRGSSQNVLKSIPDDLAVTLLHKDKASVGEIKPAISDLLQFRVFRLMVQSDFT